MTDLDKLQGTWRVTSLEVDGQAMAPSALGDARIVITRNRFVSLGMGGTYEGTVEIDATRSPRTFDLVFTAGHAIGTRNLGIYKLERDRWTICLATRGTTRPKEFATRAGTGLALETLRRERTRPTRPRPPEPDSPRRAGAATPLEGEWTMVSAVFSGKPMDASMVAWCRRITQGDVTTVVAGPQTMVKARFTIDASQSPSAIDYVNLSGANKGKSQAGIFELKGPTLRICMAEPGKPRPAEFASNPGDGRSLTTWRLASPNARESNPR